jgi:hypothetical protein
MKKRPYYFEIKNLITQFMAAFNDIAIKRFDSERATDGEYIGVGFMYAPKQRVINDLLTASRTLPLPAISISINSIARDPERVFNKLDGYVIGTTTKEDTLRLIPQPVPINIVVNMAIIARYQSDIEQIISNFVPYCDPYIAISWKLPTTENTTYEKEIRTIIEWGGNLNMQYPTELATNQLARVTCDTTFTIKGWLFKQIDKAYNKIFNIDTNIIPTLLSDSCYIYNNTNETATGDDISDLPQSFTFSGKPTLKNIDNIYYYIGRTTSSTVYTLYGKSFINITDLYLQSDEDILLNKSLQTPFLGTSLLDDYPNFDGVRISTFRTLSENSIEFTIPDIITGEGKFDIIAKNDAGYGVLSKDSVLPPHDSTIDPTLIKNPYQPACVNGMQAILR